MRKIVLKAALISTTLIATGCVSVLPDPEPANVIYRLDVAGEKSETNLSAPIIRIDRPTAARLVGTRKIIVSPDAQRLAVAGGAEWADSLPNMVQKALVDKMSTYNAITGVMPSAGAKSDYRVHVNIDNFEARFDNGEDNAPLILISYSTTLADVNTRELLGSRQFSESRRSSSASVSSIVSTMNGANDKLMQDMSNWMSGLTTIY